MTFRMLCHSPCAGLEPRFTNNQNAPERKNKMPNYNDTMHLSELHPARAH